MAKSRSPQFLLGASHVVLPLFNLCQNSRLSGEKKKKVDLQYKPYCLNNTYAKWTVFIVQSLNCVQLFATPWTVACQASLSFIILLEFAQIHVHSFSDAIQPSHRLSPLALALNHSQHWGLFHWVSSSHQVAKVLEFQLQHQFFQWIYRIDFL